MNAPTPPPDQSPRRPQKYQRPDIVLIRWVRWHVANENGKYPDVQWLIAHTGVKKSTIYAWLDTHPERDKMLVRAKEGN